jgi:hypothetical protein
LDLGGDVESVGDGGSQLDALGAELRAQLGGFGIVKLRKKRQDGKTKKS